MTGKVRVGLINAGKIGQIYANNVPFRIPALGLASVLNLFVETAKKHVLDYPISILYQDDHSCVADNFENRFYLSSYQYLPSIDNRSKLFELNIISSFLLLGAGTTSCSQYLNLIT